MIDIEILFSLIQVKGIFGRISPGQIKNPVDIVARNRVLGAGWRDALQPGQLLVDHSPRLGREPLFGHLIFQLLDLDFIIIPLAQLLADGLQLLPKEKFPLPLIHVFFHGGLQLIAHLHGFKTLGQLGGHPVQQIVQRCDFQNLLLHIDFQVQLRTDQIGNIEGVGEAVDCGDQFLGQFRGADQFLELAADVEQQRLDFFVLDDFHRDFGHLGPEIGRRIDKFTDRDLFGSTHQDLIISFRGLVQFVQVPDHAHLVQILGAENVVVLGLFAAARHQSYQTVAEEHIVDQLLGRIA